MKTMRAFAVSMFIFVVSIPAIPCTTIFISGSPDSVVAKNLDWQYPQGLVFINKRDVRKTAVFVNPATALAWTSKYASLTFTQTGREFPWEGMNEAGLSVNIMTLDSTILPKPDSRPGVNSPQWIQYILDTSANVAGAIQNARRVRIEGPFASIEHFMICDASQQCAVVEYLAGLLTVHTGPSLPYKSLTNDTYQQSAQYLQNLLSHSDPLSIVHGSAVDSLDRFARGALLSSHYTPGTDEIGYAFAALDNVHQPNFTQWNMVFSLVPRVVHFRTLNAKQIKQVELRSFDPRCSEPVKMFNMNAATGGDVTSQFLDYDPRANSALTNMATNNILSPLQKAVVMAYPQTGTRCTE